ncbi:MAG: hypothetical protein AAGM38_17350, partial [Pseudomonadota bacterium]
IIAVDGALAPGAWIGADIAARLLVSGVDGEGPGAAPIRAASIAAALPARRPDAPRFDVALRSAAPAPEDFAPALAIGEPFRIRSVHPLPEGRGAASISILLRARDAAGRLFAPALKLAQATVARDNGSLALETDRVGLNERPAETRVAALEAADVSTEIDPVDGGEWARVSLPLGALLRESVVDGAADANLVFEAALQLGDDARLRAGAVIETKVETALGPAPTAQEDRAPIRVASLARPAARVAEPALTLAAGSDDGDGAVALNARASFMAEICNRGDAPAFGLEVSGVLPPGFTLDAAAPPRLFAGGLLRGGGAPGRGGDEAGVSPFAAAAPRAFGVVRRVGGAASHGGIALAARAAEAAALAPGACVTLRAPVRAVGAAALAAPARFRVERYRSRPSAEAGRDHQAGPAAQSALRVLALRVDPFAPELAAEPGQRLVQTLRISAPGAEKALALRIPAPSGGGISWRLWRDADGGGRLDPSDPPWRDGVLLQPGESLTLFAAAAIPASATSLWRETVSAEVFGVDAEGRLASGMASFAVSRRDDRLDAVAATRVMAVDRDCDGALADEAAQDALFEPLKDAAPGECVVMRLIFKNDGDAVIERVLVEDRAPSAVAFAPGSARFVSTPDGVVGGAIEEPSPAAGPRRGAGSDDAAAGAAIRFRFVGALAPGRGGMVEYRVRLRDL